jgi:hypothetical protein
MESLVMALLFKPIAMLMLVLALAVFVYSVGRWVPDGKLKRWLLYPVTSKQKGGSATPH